MIRENIDMDKGIFMNKSMSILEGVHMYFDKYATTTMQD